MRKFIENQNIIHAIFSYHTKQCKLCENNLNHTMAENQVFNVLGHETG